MTRSKEFYAKGLQRLVQCRTVVTDPKEAFEEYYKVLSSVFPLAFKQAEISLVGATDEANDLFCKMARRVGGINDPRFQSANPKGGNAIILKWKGKSDQKPIGLMGHQDVAPVDEQNWTYPPFEGRIVDGKLYGRGAIDCKNTAYLSLQAIEELMEEGFEPNHDVYFLSADNEEMAGEGTPSIVKELKRRGVHLSLALDEGGAIVEDLLPNAKNSIAAVAVMEKGFSVFRFSAKSHGGHTSIPPKYTPWERLSNLMHDVHNHKYFKPKLTKEVSHMLIGVGEAYSGLKGFVLKHPKLFKPLITRLAPKISPVVNALFSSVITFTMAQGSLLPNVIPNEAFIIANIRHSTHAGVDYTKKFLDKLGKKYDVEVELVVGHDATKPVDANDPRFIYVKNTVNTIMPDAIVVPFIQTGATDSRHLHEICDCSLRFTPYRVNQAQMRLMHGDDEHIDIASLPEGVAFFKKLIKDWK